MLDYGAKALARVMRGSIEINLDTGTGPLYRNSWPEARGAGKFSQKRATQPASERHQHHHRPLLSPASASRNSVVANAHCYHPVQNRAARFLFLSFHPLQPKPRANRCYASLPILRPTLTSTRKLDYMAYAIISFPFVLLLQGAI